MGRCELRVFAYCDRRYLKVTRKVVGDAAHIVASPPTLAPDVEPDWFAGQDLIYVDLHGRPGSIFLWSGRDQEYPALDANTLKRAGLGGAVVFATTCYLPRTPFVEAFLAAGASAVIGGHGPNWGNLRILGGAQLLAAGVLKQMRAGAAAGDALVAAKNALRHNWRRFLPLRRTREAIADALDFEIFTEVEAI